MFWYLFHDPLGECNNSKICKMNKIFDNIAQVYCVIISLSLAHKYVQEMRCK